MSGLSVLQKEVLTFLYRETLVLDERGSNRARYWGVRWRPHAETPTAQAALSRAVRRLEQRGLLVRKNERTGGNRNGRPIPWRTTHLQLTAEGKQTAERLG